MDYKETVSPSTVNKETVSPSTVKSDDWRLTNQSKYLHGVPLRRSEYAPPNAGWDHDHCAFCTKKIDSEVFV